jgi:hypothetical protein
LVSSAVSTFFSSSLSTFSSFLWLWKRLRIPREVERLFFFSVFFSPSTTSPSEELVRSTSPLFFG